MTATLGAKGSNFSRVTRVVKVQNLVSVPANTTNPQPLPVYWPSPGVVLWLLAAPAAVSSADAWYGALSSLGFRLNVLGQSEFVTNGQSADFVQFGSIMPTSGFRFPINVEVKQNDTWQVYIRNLNGSNAYTPDVAFGLAEV
jgi:hypothetical protein